MIMFETERLLVRHWQPDDLDAIDAITSDPDVVRYVGDGKPLPRSEAERWIGVSENNYRTKGYGASAIIEKASGDFIGIGGLVRSSRDVGDAEIIYYFAKPYWGRGYAKEVVPALLDDGFRMHGLGSIIATIDPENVASQRVVEAAGMRYLRTDPPEDENDTASMVYIIDNPHLS